MPQAADGPAHQGLFSRRFLSHNCKGQSAPKTRLIAIDVGNTNTVVGLFFGKRLKQTWRVPSRSGDLRPLFRRLPSPVGGVVVSNVVPSLKRVVIESAKRVLAPFGKSPLFVSPSLKMPIRIGIRNPGKVGADRIANAVAGHVKYKTGGCRAAPLLIIDFGTATTFDVVMPGGDFIGGAIAPGLNTVNDALARRCAGLPRVPTGKPRRAIGRDTKEAIRSGVFLGYIGLVEGMIERIEREAGSPLKVIATGGLAAILGRMERIDLVDTDLTLDGLRLLYEMNA